MSPRTQLRKAVRILIAEDDIHLRNGLAEILQGEGYETLLASNGAEALALFESEKPDLICLDIMMPEQNGYEVCRQIRRQDAGVPLIFISAKSEEIDQVLGLELGADDYIIKPFGTREVVARIRAVTRRFHASRETTAPASFQMGDLLVLPRELRAKRGEGIIDLSLRDVRILELLHQKRGQVVDRETFFRECWSLDFIPNSRTLDQHISQLRKRIEVSPKEPKIIQTVHGVGYRHCD
jgi:DNA-binding response OmpR family regulator